MWITIAATAVATFLLTIIIRNLSSLERQLEHQITPNFDVHDEQFPRSMGCLLGPGLAEGNHVECLANGCRYFPAMLHDIQNAKTSITMETFIFWSGTVGRQFTDALIERARAGVPVHILVDWVGSWHMERALMDELNSEGIEFRRYRPPTWHNLAVFNNRTHRKILLIDGTIAYTGGAGIADSWDGDADDRKLWRDNQYRLTGPAVAAMQTAFMDNWIQVEAELLVGDAYFPKLERVGSMVAQTIQSGPGSGSESARIMYLLSISCAGRSVKLGQGYFVPDGLSRKIIIAALKRGVKFEIIIQGPTDAPITQSCTRHLLGDLLKAGAEIYEYLPAMYHCKVMIVDEIWVSVGSTNFDARSFRLNDEVNVNVYDETFAREESNRFDADMARSRRITYEDWLGRKPQQKALDAAASLFRKQM